MARVVKHAWTHRERLFGGTDPLPDSVKYATAFGTDTQAVTTTVEASFELWNTNAPEVFASDDASGLIIKVSGFYAAFAMVTVQSADIGVTRGSYIQIAPTSSYPTFGTEFGQNFIAFDSSLLDSTNVRTNNHGFSTITVNAFTGEQRAIIALTHPGANYSTIVRGLLLLRLSGLGGTGGTAGA